MTMILLMVMVSDQFNNIILLEIQAFQLILVGYGLGQQAATSELSLHAKLRFGFRIFSIQS